MRVEATGDRDVGRAAMDAADRAVVAVAVATLALGIPLDASAAPWAQPVVSAWAWAALLWIATRVPATERRALAACVVLATAGELFLKDVWGLYDYRLHNLPLFIPAGHALVYAASRRLATWATPGLPGFVAAGFAGYQVIAAATGLDTFGVVWFMVFAAYLTVSRDPRLCATLFLFALAIELYGTSLGGWRYYRVEPIFGWTTTNPPVWIGAVYCTLEHLVRIVADRRKSLRAYHLRDDLPARYC